MDVNEYLCKRYGVKPGRGVELPITRDDLPLLFKDFGYQVGVEVGVERGVYSETLLKAGLKVISIDPWLAYSGYREHVSQEKLDGFYQETKDRLAPYDSHIIRATSMEAVKLFKHAQVDFVYIDGNHSFQDVTNDIAEWSKIIRKGGIIAGHDFNRNKNKDYICHVKDVVQGWTYAHSIDPWFTTSERSRSWLWVIK